VPTLERRLGIELPILQAPMAGVQDHALAIAVSNAGGLGALPCAMLDAATLERQLAALRAGTPAPFAVNFFAHTPPVADPERERRWRALLAPYYVELGLDPEQKVTAATRVPFGGEAADVLDRFEPAVVSFHFGLPAPELVARVRRWGAVVLSTATTVAEARWLEERGVDVVVAQGLEAGGHRGHFLAPDLAGQLGTLDLLRAILAAGVRVPVVAAGGIADADGVAAALDAGADAAMIGTAYLLCPEATTSAVHRAALAAEGARRTAITNVFSGRPARGIVNRLMRELGPISSAAPSFPLAAAALAPLRAAAERRGRGDFSPLWAGEGATAPRAVSAADLTRDLAAGVRDHQGVS
jgi:nitronate monooxygenase